VAVDEYDAGRLSEAEKDRIGREVSAQERLESECPQCGHGLPCREECEDCQAEETRERSLFERAHSAAVLG
jgi:hypothetical protein